MPSSEEVKEAVWGLNADSAAGPDGFSGQFFKSCWDVIHKDLTLAVQEFFCGNELPISWTSTSIVLLPKISNPEHCSNYRPISLSNFTQKIISKILANRISLILPKIISPHQTGFVKGRSITDNIMLAQEMLHKLVEKRRGGNVAYKLDMAKAYDRLSWMFLLKTLRAFGFNERWIDMIWRLISNCYYSIIINGSCSGYFKSSRGLKQGDPLSPALFIIAADVLSRNLQDTMESNPSMQFSQPRGTMLVSHLSFADDILIFSNGSKRSILRLMDILNTYQKWSGQLLNTSKCTYFTAKNISGRRHNIIHQYTGFQKQDMPITYLGCPIFSGRAKIIYFNGLINAVRQKVMGWQTNLLNQAGKLILITHVLQSIPIHICAAIYPPRAVLQELNKIMSNTFWNDNVHSNKHHWISWGKCCTPKEEGGLGLRKLEDILHVQSLKLYWKLMSDQSMWSNFMKAKYQRELNDPRNIYQNASINWKRLRSVRGEATGYINDTNQGMQWKFSNMGQFSTKITWIAIRDPGFQPQSFKYIWSRRIPNKISIFMWKLVHNRLALEEIIQKRGIQLASKCKCCSINNKVENLAHLFFEGDTARWVWNHFKNRTCINTNNTNFNCMLKSWWTKAKSSENEAIICHVLPAFICWGLWKAQNRCLFEEKQMNSEEIVRGIKMEMIDMRKSQKFGATADCFSKNLDEILDLS